MNLDRFHKLDIILVCGLQGAGKSHFSREYFWDTDRKRINRSEIRKFLYEMTNFGDKWLEKFYNEENEHLVKHVESKIFEHYLHKNQKVLIDNTSLTKSARKFYIDIAKKRDKTVGIIFINTPVKKCLERNKLREGAISSSIISNLYASIELPKDKREEEVKELLVINDY